MKKEWKFVAALFLLAAAHFPAAASAQNDLEARLLACDGIASATERLNCFNSIVDGIRPVVEETATVPTSEVAAPAASEVAAVEAVDTVSGGPGEVVGAATATVAAVNVTEAVETPPAEVAAVPAESTPAHSETQMTVDETERGYQPVEQRPLEDAPLPSGAQIVEVWSNNDGRFSVRLDNGQVWRETQGSRVGKPRVGRTVEVVEGRFGGERMRIEGIRRLAWVRRTE